MWKYLNTRNLLMYFNTVQGLCAKYRKIYVLLNVCMHCDCPHNSPWKAELTNSHSSTRTRGDRATSLCTTLSGVHNLITLI